MAVPLLPILLVALIVDLRWQRIPNGLSLGGIVLGIAAQTTLFGLNGLLTASSGVVVCLVCFLPFYIGRGMAAGDVKLMAAVGAFMGPVGGFAACVCTMLVGALIAAGFMAWQRTVAWLDRDAREANVLTTGLGSKIPYAGAIAVGTALAFLNPDLLPIVVLDGGWA